MHLKNKAQKSVALNLHQLFIKMQIVDDARRGIFLCLHKVQILLMICKSSVHISNLDNDRTITKKVLPSV